MLNVLDYWRLTIFFGITGLFPTTSQRPFEDLYFDLFCSTLFQGFDFISHLILNLKFVRYNVSPNPNRQSKKKMNTVPLYLNLKQPLRKRWQLFGWSSKFHQYSQTGRRSPVKNQQVTNDKISNQLSKSQALLLRETNSLPTWAKSQGRDVSFVVYVLNRG